MNKLTAWITHAAGALVVALISTGAIYDLVPPDHQKQALSACMVILFLLGVKLPTPGRATAMDAKGKDNAVEVVAHHPGGEL